MATPKPPRPRFGQVVSQVFSEIIGILFYCALAVGLAWLLVTWLLKILWHALL